MGEGALLLPLCPLLHASLTLTSVGAAFPCEVWGHQGIQDIKFLGSDRYEKPTGINSAKFVSIVSPMKSP